MLYFTKKFAISALCVGLFIAFASLLPACNNLARFTPTREEVPLPNDHKQKKSSQPDVPLVLNNIKFKHLSVEAGLSHSTVNCILQDSKGFMWFGTDDGLSKYDGYNFTIYKHNPDD